MLTVESEEVPPPGRITTIEGDFPLDEAIIKALPNGTVVLSADVAGESAWNETARIDTRQKDGSLKSFFLKCALGDEGQMVVAGEYNSTREIFNIVPSFVPKPHAWGKCENTSLLTYFIVLDFIDMSIGHPEPKQLCSQLAKVHNLSISPTGKFGFHVAVPHGRYAQRMEWFDTWEQCFRKLVSNIMAYDLETNGPWKEFQNLSERLLTQVLPKLLGPLESDGRNIKPSLVHGDLWPGNIGTEYETGRICVFDCGAFYGHHELDFGTWRGRPNFKAKLYIEEYQTHNSHSEPLDQFDDRNRLYYIESRLWHSAHHPGDQIRQRIYQDMSYLVDKYAFSPDQ